MKLNTYARARTQIFFPSTFFTITEKVSRLHIIRLLTVDVRGHIYLTLLCMSLRTDVQLSVWKRVVNIETTPVTTLNGIYYIIQSTSLMRFCVPNTDGFLQTSAWQ